MYVTYPVASKHSCWPCIITSTDRPTNSAIKTHHINVNRLHLKVFKITAYQSESSPHHVEVFQIIYLFYKTFEQKLSPTSVQCSTSCEGITDIIGSHLFY